MHIGYVPQTRPQISAMNFRSGAYHFHKLPKNPFRSITMLHFWRIFKISLISTRVSGRSGAPHFHAQNGSSSFRSPPFSSSKRLKLVPETPIFTLDRELVPEPLPFFHFASAHTYQNLGWVPPPPPLGTGQLGYVKVWPRYRKKTDLKYYRNLLCRKKWVKMFTL